MYLYIYDVCWFRKVQHHATTMFQHYLLHTNAKPLSSKGGWFDVICTFFGHNGTPPAVVNVIPQTHMHLNIEFPPVSKWENRGAVQLYPMFSYVFPCFPMFSQWFYWLLSDPPRDPRHLVAGQGHGTGAWAVAFRAVAVGKGGTFRFAAVGVVPIHFEEVGMTLIVLEKGRRSRPGAWMIPIQLTWQMPWNFRIKNYTRVLTLGSAKGVLMMEVRKRAHLSFQDLSGVEGQIITPIGSLNMDTPGETKTHETQLTPSCQHLCSLWGGASRQWV